MMPEMRKRLTRSKAVICSLRGGWIIVAVLAFADILFCVWLGHVVLAGAAGALFGYAFKAVSYVSVLEERREMLVRHDAEIRQLLIINNRELAQHFAKAFRGEAPEERRLN